MPAYTGEIYPDNFTTNAEADARQYKLDHAAPAPGVLDVVKAAARQSNTVASFFTADHKSYKQDRGFDPLAPDVVRGYEQYPDQLRAAVNKQQSDSIKAHIDQENKDKQTVADGGWVGTVASIGSAVMDPINFVPFLGAASKVKTVASIGEAALKLSASGALSTTGSEAVLNNTQQTRTPEESLSNIAAGAVVSGVLGAGVHALGFGVHKALSDKTAAHFDTIHTTPIDEAPLSAPTSQFVTNDAAAGHAISEAPTSSSSASSGSTPHAFYTEAPGYVAPTSQFVTNDAAAGHAISEAPGYVAPAPAHAVDPLTAPNSHVEHTVQGTPEAPQTMASAGSALTDSATMADMRLPVIEDLTGWGSATSRLATSPNLEVRKLADELGTNSYIKAGNLEGKDSGTSVEQLIKRPIDQLEGELHESLNDGYKGFKKDALDNPQLLAKELHHADSTIAEADVIANPKKYTTRGYHKTILSGAMREGESLLPSVSKTAKRLHENIILPIGRNLVDHGLLDSEKLGTAYLPKVYDVHAMTKNTAQFKQTIIDDVMNRLQNPSNRHLYQDHLDYAQETADNMYNTISGAESPLSRDLKSTGGTGYTKGRTALISEQNISGFLNNDVEHVLKSYIRSTSNDIGFKTKGLDKNLNSALIKIAKEAELMKFGKPEEEQLKIEKRFQSDRNDLLHIRDKILGVKPSSKYAMASPEWMRLLRTLVATAQLGGMMLSSIPDLGRLVAVNGLKSFGPAVKIMVNSAYRGVSKAEAKRIGYGFELVNQNRMHTMWELEQHRGGGVMSRGIDRMSQGLGLFSGMAHWNQSLKVLAGTLHSDRLLELINKPKLSKAETAYLAKSGIGNDMIPRLQDQFKAHGKIHDGFYDGNMTAWDDKVALEAFDNFIYKEVNHTINTPDAGTTPNVMSNNAVMKTVLQFKTFVFAAHEQVLLAGLQEHEMRTFLGFATMTAMGALAWEAKQKIAGKDTSGTTGMQYLGHGVDSAGYFAIPWELASATHQAVGLPTDPLAPFGAGNTGRYASRGRMESLLGPGYGYVKKGTEVGHDVVTGSVTATTTHKAIQLLPYSRLWYLRNNIFDPAEQKLNELAGLQKSAGKNSEQLSIAPEK